MISRDRAQKILANHDRNGVYNISAQMTQLEIDQLRSHVEAGWTLLQLIEAIADGWYGWIGLPAPTKAFDPTKPVQTRDGRPARILATGVSDAELPIVSAITATNGQSEEIYRHRLDGRLYGDGEEARHDLINTPVKRRGWVNIYKDGTSGGVHATRERAIEKAFTSGLVACIPIEWEE